MKFSGLAAATTALSASVNAYTIISGSYNSTLTTYEFNQDDNSLSFGKKLNVPHGFAPSWITESPANDSMILVASETNPGRLASTIAESVDKFHTINDHHSGGDGPASSGFTNDGHYALAANYASGSIQAYAFDNNGNLNKLGDTYKLSGSGPNKERQSQPHPHHVVASTLDERTVYIPDLGADYIRQFAIKDEKLIQVQEHKAPSGSGPRHAVFHPELPVLYVVTELSNEILVYEVDESNGFLKLSSQISILPPSKKDKKSMQASEISISGDGKYVYAANRDVKPNDANDVDHLAILEVSNGGKELNVKEHKECGGIQPRAFILFGANEEFLIIGNTFKDAPNVVVFKRDVNSGSIDQVAKIDGQSPTSFVWLAEH